jgi:hypothetical protein
MIVQEFIKTMAVDDSGPRSLTARELIAAHVGRTMISNG